jgi:hypothetical protein
MRSSISLLALSILASVTNFAFAAEVHYYETCAMNVRQVDDNGREKLASAPIELVSNSPGGKIYRAELGDHEAILAHNTGKVIDLGEFDLNKKSLRHSLQQSYARYRQDRANAEAKWNKDRDEREARYAEMLKQDPSSQRTVEALRSAHDPAFSFPEYVKPYINYETPKDLVYTIQTRKGWNAGGSTYLQLEHIGNLFDAKDFASEESFYLSQTAEDPIIYNGRNVDIKPDGQPEYIDRPGEDAIIVSCGSGS